MGDRRRVEGGIAALAGAVLAVAGLAACDAGGPAPPPGASIPRDLTVEVLNPDRPETLRCNPEVRLGRKVSDDVLESVARALLEKEALGCGFGFAAFYLPAMRPGSGAWAIAELGPGVSVSILGLSAADEEKLLRRAEALEEIFGVWVDDTSYASVVSLHRDPAGLKLTRFYPDGGMSTEPIRITGGERGFELRDATGGRSVTRHYRVGAQGDLESWDGGAFQSASRKVRFEADLARLEGEELSRRTQRARRASDSRGLARAAAAGERWRKFEQWLTLYRGALEPARQPALYLAAMHDADERSAACVRLAQALGGGVPADLRSAPSQRIDTAPLLLALDRLLQACASGGDIQVLHDASAATAAWRTLDRTLEQVVSELRPEEE